MQLRYNGCHYHFNHCFLIKICKTIERPHYTRVDDHCKVTLERQIHSLQVLKKESVDKM